MPRATHPGLARARKKIDALDTRILDLLSQRGEAVLEAWRVKSAAGLPKDDPERVGEIMHRVTELNAGPFPEEAVRTVFGAILAESRRLLGP
jgi:chorismate mutase